MATQTTGFSRLVSLSPKEKSPQPSTRLTQPDMTAEDSTCSVSTNTGRPSIPESPIGSEHSSPQLSPGSANNQHHQQTQQQQQQQQQQHSSPLRSPEKVQQQQQHHQIIVTNGDLKQGETVIVTNDNIKNEFSLSTANTTVLQTQQQPQQQQQQHEIQVKTEPIEMMPPLPSPATAIDVANNSLSPNEKTQDLDSPPTTVISLAPAQPYPPGTAQLTFAAPAYDISGTGQYTVQVNAAEVPSLYATVTQPDSGRNNGGTAVFLDYITYRDYYQPVTAATVTTAAVATSATTDQYQTVRQHLTASTPTTVTYNQQQVTNTTDNTTNETSFLNRYLRQQTTVTTGANGSVNTVNSYKSATIHGGLTVDLPSPDSGIGEATITPRGENGALPQIFDYTELSQAQTILPITSSSGVDQAATVTVTTPGQITVLTGSTGSNSNSSNGSGTGSKTSTGGRRSWQEYGRNSEVDKVQISKIFSHVGFKYYLESPISTSQRREDDRITYINKGQFYGITLEYIHDAERPLKSATVKSLVLLVFREEKSHEEEIKAWQFWHSRQHSVKQRILDADTKNSTGIVGPIEEVTHNSIAFYWNALEGPAKINVAVQCLSTDFSNQKGVKGLPLHLQIDTFDDFRENSLPVHRGYCQIKVFCDKGAERKTRDEERRANKRKLSATGSGRKKIEEMYHPPCDRSEFYTMSDTLKPPVLFTPSEDLEKQITAGDMNFYSNPHTTDINGYEDSPPHLGALTPTSTGGPSLEKRERADSLTGSLELTITPIPPPTKRVKVYPEDRGNTICNSNIIHNNSNIIMNNNNEIICNEENTNQCHLQRTVLLFAKQENEEAFHPLHVIPPSLVGLAMAIQTKYKLDAKNIRHIFKRCLKGITVQMDDEMVKHYSNEDTVLLEVHQVDEQTHDITLVEYDVNGSN